MKTQLSMPIVIGIAVLVAVAAFFGGMQYAKMQRGATAGRFAQGGQFGGPGAAGGRFGANGGSRPVVGEISAMDSDSVTIKMPDGSSKIVILSASTAINKQATGTKSDLKSGENVMVIGTTNSDGSVTATNIQLNPMMRGMKVPSATPSGK